MNLPNHLIRRVESDGVLETFVDSVGFNSCDGAIVRIELCVTRLDYFDAEKLPDKPSARRIPVCRLAMSIGAAAELFTALQNIRAALEQRPKGGGNQPN